MASIAKKELFVWSEIEQTGDIERLTHVLEALPDEGLMRELEKKRGRSGVNKYPIRPVWNSLIAAIVFGHPSIESLRRELKRNPLVREVCGFSTFVGEASVPTAGSYSRFVKRLTEHTEEIKQLFYALVKECQEGLEGFGEDLAIDGKKLSSYAKRKGKVEGDNRGDHEAEWGKHVHRSEREQGKIVETVEKWFGFRLHLIVDARYELPVEYSVLPAPVNEMPVAHRLIERMENTNPELLKRCEHFTGDKGYDDVKLHKKLWDDHEIKGVIDIRRSWKDGEETRAYEAAPGVVYSNKGEVSCISPYFEEQKKMAFRGLEKDRNSLKYRCPAVHYGVTCKGQSFCDLSQQVRIPLSLDRRIFTPVARDSYKWGRCYRKRTAVERVNARIDTMFGFDRHTIRGLEKMDVRISLAFIVMLAFAVGKVRQEKAKEIRQFLRAV